MNQDGDYTCTCASGYEGKNCTVGKFNPLCCFYNNQNKIAISFLALIHILKSG